MDTAHFLVFFRSVNGGDGWEPVEREHIPDWLRDPGIVDRLMAGEQVVNTADKAPMYYRIVEPVRPRPARDLSQESGKSRGGIILLH